MQMISLKCTHNVTFRYLPLGFSIKMSVWDKKRRIVKKSNLHFNLKLHQLICLNTNKLSTTYVCFPELKVSFTLLLDSSVTPNLIFYSCSNTLISLWRTAFSYDSFTTVLGGFCSLFTQGQTFLRVFKEDIGVH